MRSYLGAGFRRRFLGLCLPPLALGLVDGSLTLLGQSSFYWENHLAVNEANPLFAGLLQVHPVAFLAGAVAWLAMLCAMILVLPRLAALILSIALTFGHTIGSGNWLFDHFELGYQLANGYYLLSACVLGLGIHHAMASGMRDAEVLNVPANVRARIGGVLFAAGALLWLFPWQH